MASITNVYGVSKKLLSLSMALILVLLWIVPVQASELGNVQTGTDSENTNSVSVDNAIDISVTQDADVRKSISLDLNTGGNTVTNNTTVKDVSSGDIDFDVEVTAHVNQMDEFPMLPSSLGDLNITHTNERTGTNSTNENNSTVNNSVSLNYANRATVNEAVSVVANTGNNIVADNTSVGNVVSGSIRGEVVLNNVINTGPSNPPTMPPTLSPSPTPTAVPTTLPSVVPTPHQVVPVIPLTSIALAAVGGADLPFGDTVGRFFPAGAEASSLLGYALLGLWVALFSSSLVVRTRLKGAVM